MLTFCICQAQSRGVDAAGLSGAFGQTDGSAPAGTGPALRLWQGHVGVWRLVEYLQIKWIKSNQKIMLRAAQNALLLKASKHLKCVWTTPLLQKDWGSTKHFYIINLTPVQWFGVLNYDGCKI